MKSLVYLLIRDKRFQNILLELNSFEEVIFLAFVFSEVENDQGRQNENSKKQKCFYRLTYFACELELLRIFVEFWEVCLRYCIFKGYVEKFNPLLGCQQ